MSRLSTDPATIRRQIDLCCTALDQFKSQLETVPTDDLHEQDSLNREIRREQSQQDRLKRHLLGLENEFDEMLEDTIAQYDKQ